MILLKFKKKIGTLILSCMVAAGALIGAHETRVYADTLKTYTQTSIDWKAKHLLPVKDKETLLQILRDKNIISDRRAVYQEFDVVSSADMASAATTESAATPPNYSTTNVQVEGVDEADTMKNDGRYIYMIKERGRAVSILDTKGTLQELSAIRTSDNNHYFEQLLLDKNTLIVIGTMHDVNSKQTTASYLYPEEYSKTFTTADIYDVTDKANPKLTRKVTIEGYINKIRKIENQLYIITSSYRDIISENHLTDEQLLTYYSDSADDNPELKPVSFDNFYCEPWSNCCYTNVLATVPLNETKEMMLEVILGTDEEIYMNEKSLYFVDSEYSREIKNTISYISKFELNKEKPTYTVTGLVEGKILNQFSMDEYNGNLRIATTNNNSQNAIYILNSQLKQIGAVTNLAEGERIYSARFEGDRGYLVTFKETDPLFVFDLSNPRQPKALGKLKIPGFSQYLHPLGDHLVVGIGRSTNEIITRTEDGKEHVTGTSVGGIKLSLFDVTNPQSPVEINHIILGEVGSSSEALENHNAVMAVPDKKMLAIPVYLNFSDKENFSGAYVFSVENGKLTGKAKLGRLTNTGSYYSDDSRVCYIDGKMYYIYDDAVNMYSIETFKRLQTLYLMK